jgi:NADPH:quinone reductase
MKAALCRAYGPPESVVVAEVDPPEVGPGQVRVQVQAAAVNFPDVLLAAGEYQIKVPPPFVVGSEFAGVVDEVGPDVSGLVPGDRVVGTALNGAFAELVVVAADTLRPVPATVALRQAAACGVAHRTAYHVLRSVARIEPGQELVVLGAGGGVGLAAVQLGARLGATVTAVASSAAKLEAAAGCGAARGIDHRAGDLRQALRDQLPGGADAVIDPVGGALAEPALRALHWGGRFVTVGYASGEIPRIPLNLVLLKGVEILGFQFIDFVAHRPDEFRRNEDELDALLVEGRVQPHIGASFALEEVTEALALVAGGQAIGKVVLDLGPTEATPS